MIDDLVVIQRGVRASIVVALLVEKTTQIPPRKKIMTKAVIPMTI
jgi:hypothetical protein